MNGIIFIQYFIMTLLGISILNFESIEGRGYRRSGLRRYEDTEESESSSESYEDVYGDSYSSEDRALFHQRGRGLFDSITSGIADLGGKAWKKAKTTDWKKVGSDVKDKAKSAYHTLKKLRRKRSYETIPMPVEQLITTEFLLEKAPKSMYNKRSVRKFETKTYLSLNNQL